MRIVGSWRLEGMERFAEEKTERRNKTCGMKQSELKDSGRIEMCED